jgi:uncharacterized protein (TIGR02246 family)
MAIHQILAPQADSGDPIAAAVRASNDAFVTAVATADADGIAAVYAADADLLAPDVTPITGRSAIREYWASGLAAGISGVTLETRSLDVTGETVIEVGAFVLRLAPDGQAPSAVRGKYVVHHRRQADGVWRWQLDIFNTNGAAA